MIKGQGMSYVLPKPDNSVAVEVSTSNPMVTPEPTTAALEWCKKWFDSKEILGGYIKRLGFEKSAVKLMEVLNSDPIKSEKKKWAAHPDLVSVMHVLLQYDLIPNKEATLLIRGNKLVAEINYEGLIAIANRAKPEMELSTSVWTVADYVAFQQKHNRIPVGNDYKDAPTDSEEQIMKNTMRLFELPSKTEPIKAIESNTLALIQVIWTNRFTGVRMGEVFGIGHLKERMQNVSSCTNRNGVWKSDPTAMWVKTAVKQFLKLKTIDLGLPFELLHTEDERLDAPIRKNAMAK
jgi:hypothetical protein